MRRPNNATRMMWPLKGLGSPNRHYQFSENNQIELSLVHRVEHDGCDVIFIAEFTIQTIKNIFYTFENVKGGITYLIYINTPGGMMTPLQIAVRLIHCCWILLMY
eukprot:1002317_1